MTVEQDLFNYQRHGSGVSGSNGGGENLVRASTLRRRLFIPLVSQQVA